MNAALLLYYYVNGESAEQMAKWLNISAGSIRYMIPPALKLLVRVLDERNLL